MCYAIISNFQRYRVILIILHRWKCVRRHNSLILRIKSSFQLTVEIGRSVVCIEKISCDVEKKVEGRSGGELLRDVVVIFHPDIHSDFPESYVVWHLGLDAELRKNDRSENVVMFYEPS